MLKQTREECYYSATFKHTTQKHIVELVLFWGTLLVKIWPESWKTGVVDLWKPFDHDATWAEIRARTVEEWGTCSWDMLSC